jgi:hypothetical protein
VPVAGAARWPTGRNPPSRGRCAHHGGRRGQSGKRTRRPISGRFRGRSPVLSCEFKGGLGAQVGLDREQRFPILIRRAFTMPIGGAVVNPGKGSHL